MDDKHELAIEAAREAYSFLANKGFGPEEIEPIADILGALAKINAPDLLEQAKNVDPEKLRFPL